MDVAKDYGISDGGSILLCTKRVIAAILRLEKRFITWPDEEQRNKIAQEINKKGIENQDHKVLIIYRIPILSRVPFLRRVY